MLSDKEQIIIGLLYMVQGLLLMYAIVFDSPVTAVIISAFLLINGVLHLTAPWR